MKRIKKIGKETKVDIKSSITIPIDADLIDLGYRFQVEYDRRKIEKALDKELFQLIKTELEIAGVDTKGLERGGSWAQIGFINSLDKKKSD